MAAHDSIPHPGIGMHWTDGSGTTTSEVDLRWENEGWTAEVNLVAARSVAVMRFTASWSLRQFLLFRDMSEPDLWLASDGTGRWGEMNGAHRTDLDGCRDLAVAGSPFFAGATIRRLPLAVGHSAEIPLMVVDTETLGVAVRRVSVARLGPTRWSYWSPTADAPVSADVDARGFVIDEPPGTLRGR